ncbi:MAG: hypothetical protein NT165_02255 [Candidatus Falkowbacteria bacterium]|nr:hypothetical protein [Candidatus Falkowbacteria bacterium]
MKKIIILAIVAMIIAPAVAFCQLTIQDNEQISILNNQIREQRIKVKKAQDKIVEVVGLNSSTRQLKAQINSLNLKNAELDADSNLIGLTLKETRDLAKMEAQLQENQKKFQKLDFDSTSAVENFNDEDFQLNQLVAQKKLILSRATTNTDTPTEVGFREKTLRYNGLDVKEKTGDLNYKQELQSEALKLLKKEKTDSTVYQVLLKNESKTHERSFTLKGVEGNRSFVLAPNSSMVVSVLPQQYLCDIVDLSNRRCIVGQKITVGLQMHSIDGKNYSGWAVAPTFW